MFDIKRIRLDIRATALAIQTLKHRFRESHQPNLQPGDHYALMKLKHRATLLCSLRASMRGKIHLKRFASAEEQSKFVGDFGKDFLRAAAA